jgi:hypothetical protein
MKQLNKKIKKRFTIKSCLFVVLVLIISIAIAAFIYIRWVKTNGIPEPRCNKGSSISEHKIIPVLQKIADRNIIIYSESNKNIVQMYDASIFYTFINRILGDKCTVSGYTYFQEDGTSISGADTNACEDQKRKLRIVKTFLDSYPKNIVYDDFMKQMNSYGFPGKYDVSNTMQPFNKLLDEALKSGNVVIFDSSGKIVPSFILDISGYSSNCEGDSQSEYKLPDGTIFKENRSIFMT